MFLQARQYIGSTRQDSKQLLYSQFHLKSILVIRVSVDLEYVFGAAILLVLSGLMCSIYCQKKSKSLMLQGFFYAGSVLNLETHSVAVFYFQPAASKRRRCKI